MILSRLNIQHITRHKNCYIFLSGEPSSYMQSISEYYQKENKTLNVNVLAEGK